MLASVICGRTSRSNCRPRSASGTSTNVDDHDWEQIKEFLDSFLGYERYGWVTYVGLLLYDLTGTRLCLQEARTTLCSGLVCDALTRRGIIWSRPPYACTPAGIDADLERLN